MTDGGRQITSGYIVLSGISGYITGFYLLHNEHNNRNYNFPNPKFFFLTFFLERESDWYIGVTVA